MNKMFAGIALAGAMLIPGATGHGAMIARDHQFHTGTCQFNNPNAHVLCVERAPADVCRGALNTTKPCWWFVGSDTMIVFNWKGQVSSS